MSERRFLRPIKSSPQLSRMILAFAAAGAIAGLAYLLQMLTVGGGIAATFIGGTAVLAGRGWITLLLFFFITSSVLSRWRAAERARKVKGALAKGARRDAVQVLANGLVFATAAMLSTYGNVDAWRAIGAGAIATATADTWSTEIGTVIGGTPRMITTGRVVQPGTSGGVTIAGFVSAFTGSVLAAVVASMMDWRTPVHAVVVGGVVGSLVDSLLGATVQERRWCDACAIGTEQRIHNCGTATAHRGGLAGFDNDVVNLVSIIAGAVLTWTLT
jgi:uncharacterized protein (TIGR00297 family)